MPRFAVYTPTLTVLLATLLTALPLGAPLYEYQFTRYLIPLLPYMVIHFWLLEQPVSMPSPVVFLAGLLIDVLTHGPLGFWALVYLIGTMIVALTGRRFNSAFVRRLASFALTSGLLAIGIWSLASLFHLRVVDPLPIMIAAAASATLFPIVMGMFGSIAPDRTERANPSLQRQG